MLLIAVITGWIGFVANAGIELIFGLWPAKKAARLNPIGSAKILVG